MNVKDIIKTVSSKSNKTIINDDIYIGQGIMKWGNCFIPLDAISIVELVRNKDKEYGKTPIVAAVSLLGVIALIISKMFLLALICFFIFIGCLLIIANIYDQNKTKVYTLFVRLNNGENHYLVHSNLDFIYRMMDAIKEGIDNRKSGYFIDMSNNGNIQYNVDKSMGKFTDNTIVGDGINITTGDNIKNGGIMAGGDINFRGTAVTGKGSTVNNGITEKEWESLENFFRERKEYYSFDTDKKEKCEELEKLSKEKDKTKMKNYLSSIGKTILSEIIKTGIAPACANAVIKLINRIIT